VTDVTTPVDDTDTDTTAIRPTTRRARFGAFYRSRPFVGGLLTVIAGAEIFLSGQLDLTVGKFHVALGIEGLQATIIPLVIVVLGVLAIAMPVHRIFYGVISLALSVSSLIGVNLGGFFLGMIIGIVGGILIVSWMPKTRTVKDETDVAAAVDLVERDAAAEPRPFVQRRPRIALSASTHMRALLPHATGHAKPLQ
jgi:Family of unknown function (DUF6114)